MKFAQFKIGDIVNLASGSNKGTKLFDYFWTVHDLENFYNFNP